MDDNINGATELSGNADVHGDTPTYVHIPALSCALLTGREAMQRRSQADGVRMTIIDEAVAPGEHYVECMILGPNGKETAPFKLLGV